MKGKRGVAQPGSAPVLGTGGRRFESCRPDNESPLYDTYSGLFVLGETSHSLANPYADNLCDDVMKRSVAFCVSYSDSVSK